MPKKHRWCSSPSVMKGKRRQLAKRVYGVMGAAVRQVEGLPKKTMSNKVRRVFASNQALDIECAKRLQLSIPKGKRRRPKKK